MCRSNHTDAKLLDRLDSYDRIAEIGIGERVDVAATLVANGVDVMATDIVDRSVPDGIDFVVDDVTDPTVTLYRNRDALYGLRLPPELHRPAYELAREVDADFLFTTLGGDPSLVSTRPISLQVGTLYIADMDDPAGP